MPTWPQVVERALRTSASPSTATTLRTLTTLSSTSQSPTKLLSPTETLTKPMYVNNPISLATLLQFEDPRLGLSMLLGVDEAEGFSDEAETKRKRNLRSTPQIAIRHGD